MRRPAQIALVLMGGGVVSTAVLSPALLGCETLPGQPDVCLSSSSSTSTSVQWSGGRSSASGGGLVRSASADGGTSATARGGFGAAGSAHSSGS